MEAAPSNNRFVIIARDGLKLRSGPSLEFGVVRTISEGIVVNVLSREGMWALVDLEGDGKADGFMNLSFLRALDTPSGSAATIGGLGVAASAFGDITGLVTPDMVKQMFPTATKLTNITANLPFVLAGLRARQLGDRAMVLMSIATIRAETEVSFPSTKAKVNSTPCTSHSTFMMQELRKVPISATPFPAMVRVSKVAAIYN